MINLWWTKISTIDRHVMSRTHVLTVSLDLDTVSKHFASLISSQFICQRWTHNPRDFVHACCGLHGLHKWSLDWLATNCFSRIAAQSLCASWTRTTILWSRHKRTVWQEEPPRHFLFLQWVSQNARLSFSWQSAGPQSFIIFYLFTAWSKSDEPSQQKQNQLAMAEMLAWNIVIMWLFKNSLTEESSLQRNSLHKNSCF